MMEEFSARQAAYKLEDYNRIVNHIILPPKRIRTKKNIGRKLYRASAKVSDTLIDLGMDATTVIAALLHDVLEDTSVTEKEIEETFGKKCWKWLKPLQSSTNSNSILKKKNKPKT